MLYFSVSDKNKNFDLLKLLDFSSLKNYIFEKKCFEKAYLE